MDAIIVNASNEQRCSEWTGASVLSKGLLEIANLLHENINRNRGSVCDAVDLSLNPSPSNELAGIGHEAGGSDSNVAINFEHLFDGLWDDQATDDALVAHQDNPVLELQSCCCCPSLDGFTSIFNLKQASIWAECRNSVIVSSSTWLHGMTSIVLVWLTLYEDAGRFRLTGIVSTTSRICRPV